MVFNTNKCVFFDRDGVINKKALEHDYIKNWNEFEIIPEIIDVMKHVQEKGYKIIIVTNQRGIARKIVSEENLAEIHHNLNKLLMANGIFITDIFYCPHGIDENCSCRKPKPGMLLEAKKLYSIDFDKSFLIGDSESDILAANSVNVKSILYCGNEAKDTLKTKATYVITNLTEVCNIVL